MTLIATLPPETLGEAWYWARRQIDAVDARVLLREACGCSDGAGASGAGAGVGAEGVPGASPAGLSGSLAGAPSESAWARSPTG